MIFNKGHFINKKMKEFLLKEKVNIILY